MDTQDTQRALNERERFMDHVLKKKPTIVQIEKGKHKGKSMHIVAVQKGPYAVEYWGIVGKRKIAVMLTNPPIGGISHVTNSVVAHSFWRCGVAQQVYSEIQRDLQTVGAALEPHWNAMTPDAARFWKTISTNMPAIQQRLDTILQEMELSGVRAQHDAMKDEDLSQFWNGESMSKKKLEKVGIDTTSHTR
ncbi:MAG: hypothetical protein RI911_911 [Candidatus Parcubacteria bacterium]|jgi:hypothetical protein